MYFIFYALLRSSHWNFLDNIKKIKIWDFCIGSLQKYKSIFMSLFSMVLIMFIIYADSTLNDRGQGRKLIVEISTSKSNARF